MAKLQFPLLSVSAKGHFSKNMTFYSHSKKSYLMRYKNTRGLFVSPRAGFGRIVFGSFFFGYNRRLNQKNLSKLQNERRALFSSCWLSFSLLSPEQKAELDARARIFGISGANLYMSEFIKENI